MGARGATPTESRRTNTWTAAIAAALVGCACALPRSVEAAPGDGIRVGEVVIHPGVQTELGFQSNVHLLAEPLDVDHPDDWWVRIVPRIEAEKNGGRARFSLLALYDWRKYAYNTELDSFQDFELGAALSVNEERPLALAVENRMRSQSRPSELDLYGNHRRLSNAARVSTLYKPGGALEVKPSAFWNYDKFSASETRDVFAEKHTTGAAVDARWAFLSRTVLAVTGEGGQVRYTESVPLPAAGRDVNSGSNWWHAEAGLVGQVRPKVNIALKLGYGQAVYPKGESLSDARGVTALAKMEWVPRATNHVSLAYDRDFRDVFFTNFRVSDRITATYRHLLAGEWLAEAAGAAAWQQYSEPFDRRDFVTRSDLSMRRVLREWADVGLSYGFERRWSSETQVSYPSADPESDYTTHRVLLTGDVRW